MTLSEMIFTMKDNNQDTDSIHVIVCLSWVTLACTATINLRKLQGKA